MYQLDEPKQISMLLRQRKRFKRELRDIKALNTRLEEKGELTVIDTEYVECLEESIDMVNQDLKELGYR